MSEKKYTKFEKDLRLSSKGIRGQRAEFATQDAIAAQDDLINSILKRKRDYERKLVKLQDVHPDSELSLQVTRDSADEYYWENWVAQVQKNKIQLANIEVELKLAKETKETWFTENCEL